LCKAQGLDYARDVFKHYRSDSASAIEAGNDTRTALVGFGVDASHGYERTHLSSLTTVARLLGLYMQSKPTFLRDKEDLASLKGFPHQPARDVIQIET
jgi:putative aminopeptidase FrvX